MQEPQSRIPSFESGKVVLSTGDMQILNVNLTSKHIDVNVDDKAFIKRVIAMRNELIPKRPNVEEKEALSISGPLSMVRTVAETLCNWGITITFSYKGDRIATIGADAKPIFLHHITKTRGVALNSLYTAIKLMI